MEKEKQGGIERPAFYHEKEYLPELLAPAGSYAALVSVINAGADSVYVGAQSFSARAYAKNLGTEELLRGIDYAHLHGAKVHLTLNTCLKGHELEAALSLLEPFYLAGLDAVIVQDFGLLCKIPERFPEIPIHASTQMGIMSSCGADFLKEMGVRRVILARELSLDEIRTVKESTGMETEVFVHGALCYSVSGQCLMSSMLGGRSANRGRCAGPCRLPYRVQGQKEASYPMSLKDLCAVRELPDLLSAGVDAFKIEGRQKAGDYAARVTEIYRKYLDLALSVEKEAYRVEEKDLELLLQAGNRSGFTSAYFTKHNDKEMVSLKTPAHTSEANKAKTGKPEEKKRGIEVLWRLCPGERARLTLRCGEVSVQAEGEITEPAKSSPLTEEALKEKTALGDTFFYAEEFGSEIVGDCFLPASAVKGLRRKAVEELTEALLSGWKRKKQAAAVSDQSDDMTPYDWKRPFFSAFLSSEEQLLPVLAEYRIRRIFLDRGMYRRKTLTAECSEDADRIRKAGKEAFFALPPLLRKKDAAFYREAIPKLFDSGIRGFLAGSYDALGLLTECGISPEQILLDASLYTWSDSAANAFLAMGYSGDTVPFELSEKELRHRRNERSELIVYGRLPLMQTAGCIFKTTDSCTGDYPAGELNDRLGKRFPVKAFCEECQNTIYNADVLNLLQEDLTALRPGSFRYVFTTENAKEVQAVLEGRGAADTKGHFHRGVE